MRLSLPHTPRPVQDTYQGVCGVSGAFSAPAHGLHSAACLGVHRKRSAAQAQPGTDNMSTTVEDATQNV